MNIDLLQQAANQARGLAIDAIHDRASGHLGLPLGCAEIGAALFGDVMNICPSKPRWLNRDRFILSGGHGSMFLYAWLHISGYDVKREDVMAFRTKGSITPGHPEYRCAPGVECTTGPLGQGIANAVGFALSAKHAAARYNTADCKVFDQTIFCLGGDGCMQEGVAREAVALAGVLKLDNLVLIYDSNDITLDAPADKTQASNTVAQYEAHGWETIQIDGHNLPLVLDTLRQVKQTNNGKPKLIIAKTVIGKGVPEVEATTKGHGEGGAKFWESAHERWGIPAGDRYYVSPEVKAYFTARSKEQAKNYESWLKCFNQWKINNPELSMELELGRKACKEGVSAKVCLPKIPEFDAGYADATRSAGAVALNSIAQEYPYVITTSADLYSSNKNYLNGMGDYAPATPQGRNFWFGIREHAMAGICNGIAYDGIFRVSAATFCVFVDYMRASIRVAALAELPVTYILTHDSVAVGEDGPTHQPVETVSGLRVIPNLDVIRPADPEETVGAYAAAMERVTGPTALILTRQKVDSLNQIPAKTRREGVLKGAYIARREKGELKAIVISCGSELGVALQAAEQVGDGVRVVSMPSMYRFDNQPDAYKEEILPASCKARVSIEAGVTALWWKYVGTEGKVVGIDRFGFSAPGDLVLHELGMNTENLIEVIRAVHD